MVIYGIIKTYIYSSTILRIDKNQMEAINSLAKIFGQKVQEQTKPPKNLTPPPIVESNTYTMDPPIQDIPIIYQDIEYNMKIPRLPTITELVTHS